jgi:electron transport complex protein RnfB
MNENPYRRLAQRLDALPNGFPPTNNGVELDLLATLFSEEEAALTAELKFPLETPDLIAARTDYDTAEVSAMLDDMARRILIRRGRTPFGVGYGLMPFVVGIYEGLLGRISAEQAQLFEDYYQQAFGQMLSIKPQVHRVIPIKESVPMDLAIEPYESATAIVDGAQAWGVMDCICRKQKAQIGEGCDHPVDVCLVMNKRPNVYDKHNVIQAISHDEALAVLERSAEAGLVHSVSNNQQGTNYICNCCTCSCGILRGMADLGIANVVARSSFVNAVERDLCSGCEECIDFCQFDALALDDEFIVSVDGVRCVGCGVCVPNCPDHALSLARRPEEEIKAPPTTMIDWGMQRAVERRIDLSRIL